MPTESNQGPDFQYKSYHIERSKLLTHIPKEYFTSNTWRSMCFFLFDTLMLILLYTVAAILNSWYFWPIFWLLAGTFFWAYFILAHDCGHGSFSKYRWVNNMVGYICNAVMLVPFHGWQISHRRHHATTNNYDKEEAFRPLTKSQYHRCNFIERSIRLDLFLFLFPFYLLFLRSDQFATHYFPNRSLYKAQQYKKVIFSSITCVAMLSIIVILTYFYGFAFLLKYYLGPFSVCHIWIAFVTYMQHTDKRLPWLSDEEWTPEKSALAAVDRNYGLVDLIHHRTGNYHVIHHLYPKIPHYHLKKATEAIYDEIKDYYFKDHRSVLISFVDSFKHCHYVDEDKAAAFYQSDKLNVSNYIADYEDLK